MLGPGKDPDRDQELDNCLEEATRAIKKFVVGGVGWGGGVGWWSV